MLGANREEGVARAVWGATAAGNVERDGEPDMVRRDAAPANDAGEAASEDHPQCHPYEDEDLDTIRYAVTRLSRKELEATCAVFAIAAVTRQEGVLSL